MNKAILLLTMVFLCTHSYGQSRLFASSGYASFNETGYENQQLNTIGLTTDFNSFRFLFRANTMKSERLSGQKNFNFCDSFVQSGWHATCAPGYDSIVNSTFHNTYRKTEVGVDALWRKDSTSRMWNGLSLDFVFFSRELTVDDAILDLNRIENGNAFLVSYVNMIDLSPFKSDQWLFHVRTRLGVLYSRQDQCTDINCDNFFENETQPYLSIQAGLSFALN